MAGVNPYLMRSARFEFHIKQRRRVKSFIDRKMRERMLPIRVNQHAPLPRMFSVFQQPGIDVSQTTRPLAIHQRKIAFLNNALTKQIFPLVALSSLCAKSRPGSFRL